MLKLPERSPPVPQVSNTGPDARASLTACSRIVVREADELVGPFALHRQADQQPGNLCRRSLPAHDHGHCRRRLRLRQILVPTESFDQLGEHHLSSRKFLRSWRPSGVSTDSGWNCTPCTGQAR